MNNIPPYFMIFDVESIGLHGEAFAIAGGIFTPDGNLVADGAKFCFSCDPFLCDGAPDDRKWVSENVPALQVTHESPLALRDAFWRNWMMAKKDWPGCVLAAECAWPVEARLLLQCVDDDPIGRNWDGPYPLHDIASIMMAKGMDPMATYDRSDDCKPAHHPLMDVMHSAKLLARALAL